MTTLFDQLSFNRHVYFDLYSHRADKADLRIVVLDAEILTAQLYSQNWEVFVSQCLAQIGLGIRNSHTTEFEVSPPTALFSKIDNDDTFFTLNL